MLAKPQILNIRAMPMLPQRRPAWLFSFHISPNRSLDFTLLRLCFEQIATSVLETIADYGETRTASKFFADSNTKKYRHPATSSARKSPKSDHRRRYGFRGFCAAACQNFYHSKLFLQRSVALLGPTYQLQMRSGGGGLLMRRCSASANRISPEPRLYCQRMQQSSVSASADSSLVSFQRATSRWRCPGKRAKWHRRWRGWTGAATKDAAKGCGSNIQKLRKPLGWVMCCPSIICLILSFIV